MYEAKQLEKVNGREITVLYIEVLTPGTLSNDGDIGRLHEMSYSCRITTT